MFVLSAAGAAPALAADRHYTSVGNTDVSTPPGGFNNGSTAINQNDRAIYDIAGTGQSYISTSRQVGQLVFLAPYSGSGFVPHPNLPAPNNVFTIYGLDGVGVDNQVNQRINLPAGLALAGAQEWRISSESGSIGLLPSGSRNIVLNLGGNMLTLNAVNAANKFILSNPISGTGGLIVKGAGTTYLTAANTYSGGTFLNGGTISVGADNNLGASTGGLSFDGGTLELTSSFTSSRAITLASGGGTIDTQANTNVLSGAISGSGGLTKIGDGVLNLAGVASHTGATTIQSGTLGLVGAGSLADSKRVIVDSTFDISAITAAGTNIRSLAGTSVVALGAKTLTLTDADDIFAGTVEGTGGLALSGGTQVLTGANTYSGGTTITGGTLYLGNGGALGSVVGNIANDGTLVFNRSDDISFGGVISGNGTVEHDGPGMTTLTGDSSGYLGSTNVNAGILSVNGKLGGSMDVLGGRLQGTGTVGTTTNHLGGVIAPGNSIGTLTVAGNYTGNGGALEIETVLGNDSSATDLLHITGNSILGTGATQVHVFNVGGLGAQTTADGIRIVQVDGTSAADAFVLNGPAIGGAYSYKLFQNGLADTTDGDWYLRAASLAPTTPVYQNYPQVLLGMIALPTLEQRVGDRRHAALDGEAETGQQAIWTRIEGAHSHVEANASSADASYDVDTALVQAGIDGQLSETAAGRLVAGLTAQYSRANADIFSGLGDGGNTTDSYGIGATLTWYGENGFYVDGQAQAAILRSDMDAAGIGKIGDGIHGSGYALSLEAGRKIGLDGAWSLTPQAQLAYASVDFDAFTDPFGANVSLRRGDSLKGRLGAALNYDAQATGSHVYGIANLTYEFLDGTSVAVSGVDMSFEPQRFGAELGLGGTYKWAGGKYALYGEALASTSFEGSHALKGTAGLTVRF
ncbi:autotransporter outer membrane beta-barrel domain-containing protein [Mesorhizobium shangrilense]|uniref:Autotransporter outer membrane beta-barrel domain-containing protein n=1 Tax=Mesorhizobium shangrilense TaxID=460060 RepID=A0ABV2DRM0_9HYPH